MVTQFISTQSVIDLCEETEKTPGARVGIRWWEQAGIDPTGSRERAAIGADADEDGGAGTPAEKSTT